MHPINGFSTDPKPSVWREVSVDGGVYALRESRSTPQKSSLVSTSCLVSTFPVSSCIVSTCLVSTFLVSTCLVNSCPVSTCLVSACLVSTCHITYEFLLNQCTVKANNSRSTWLVISQLLLCTNILS